MDSLTMHRQERVSSLSSDEFTTRLRERSSLVNRIVEVTQEAINEGEIEAWEYPQVEAAVAGFSAALHGLPLTISAPPLVSARN